MGTMIVLRKHRIHKKIPENDCNTSHTKPSLVSDLALAESSFSVSPALSRVGHILNSSKLKRLLLGDVVVELIVGWPK